MQVTFISISMSFLVTDLVKMDVCHSLNKPCDMTKTVACLLWSIDICKYGDPWAGRLPSCSHCYSVSVDVDDIHPRRIMMLNT